MPSIMLQGHAMVAENRVLPSLKELGQMTLTFILVCFSYIFFRAESLNIAWDYLGQIFDLNSFVPDVFPPINIGLIGLLLLIEWFNREYYHGLGFLVNKNSFLKWLVYIFILFIILLFRGDAQGFIYFQF